MYIVCFYGARENIFLYSDQQVLCFPSTHYDKNHYMTSDNALYNFDNPFWKIIKGNMPCEKIMETNYSISFYDIKPKAKVHALVIPKGPYIDFKDFFTKASPEEVTDFLYTIVSTTNKLGVDESGYRIINNNGIDSHQEVPHFHWHILGGESLDESI